VNVENWIAQVHEPQRLFLAWQAPDQMKDRHRWAVGIVTRTGEDCALRYFYSGSYFEKMNSGRSFEELLKLGYEGYAAFPLRREMHARVLSTFMRRLPPRTRSDFEEYTRRFRLAPTLSINNFALLGRTEAKLPSDGFSLVDPLDAEADECDLMLEVAGYRYYAQDATPSVGMSADIQAEPDNPFDHNAVAILVDSKKIGNINRLQSETFLRWLATRQMTACIEDMNNQADKPRAFVFVRVRRRSLGGL
jgi:hypothetical protein